MLRLAPDGTLRQWSPAGAWRPVDDGAALPAWCERGPSCLTLVRTPDTCHDLYYMEWRGSWYACDELRPLVQLLPLAEREIPAATRAYLRAYRTLPYVHAIVGPIRRVHMFQRVACTAAPSGFRTASTVHALRVSPSIVSLAEAAAQVGETFDRAAHAIGGTGNRTLLLSGGVDSTLLATCYRGEPFRYAVSVPGFKEYAIETSYAREAAALLGVPLEEVNAPVDRLQSLLVDAVRDSLQPPNHTQTVLLYAAFRSAPGTYVTAQFADALFGFGRSVTGYAAAGLAGVLGVLQKLPLRPLLPARLVSALRVHEALQLPHGDSASWMSTYARYLSRAGAANLVGHDMLAQLSAERWQVTNATYPGPAPETAHAAMAYGQWLDYVHDDAIAIWTAMARAAGATLVAPHHSTAMIEVAHRIGMPLRYSDGTRAKPVLRAMLGTRLPAYSLTKRKLGSGLPMSAMVSQAYPDLLRELAAHELAARQVSLSDGTPDSAEATWSVLAASLWEEAVRQAPGSDAAQ